MIEIDEHALICDLAETYGIFNYKELPPLLVASFCYGLRPSSRIKMKMNNIKVELDTLLLAGIVDRLSILIWLNTKDAEKGRNIPKSIVDEIVNDKSHKNKYKCLNSSKDFIRERNNILKKIKGAKNGN